MFSGWRFLVTGATGGGTGSALARHFAAKGATVLVNGRTAQAVEAFLAGEPGGDYVEAAGDIASAGDVDAIAARHREPVDVLICNAATSHPRHDIAGYPLDQWRNEIDTMLTGPFLLARSLIPRMAERGFGRVIMVSSNAARRGTWGRGAGYSAAKAGLEGLARQIALEYGRSGITANVIAPSQIDTPRARRGGRKSDDEFRRYAEALVPVGRVGTPGDICALAEYIASRDAGYLNGQTIALDGGSALSSRLTQARGATA